MLLSLYENHISRLQETRKALQYELQGYLILSSIFFFFLFFYFFKYFFFFLKEILFLLSGNTNNLWNISIQVINKDG